jgi:hypothetical protein
MGHKVGRRRLFTRLRRGGVLGRSLRVSSSAPPILLK